MDLIILFGNKSNQVSPISLHISESECIINKNLGSHMWKQPKSATRVDDYVQY